LHTLILPLNSLAIFGSFPNADQNEDAVAIP